METALESLKKVGGKVAVHSRTLDEVEASLSKMLSLQPQQRYGPTADALRARQVSIDFINAIRRNPESIVKNKGIYIDNTRLEDYPNRQKYFDQEKFESFVERSNWVEGENAKQHDAFALTNIIRKREGQRFTDLFDSNYVFVTENSRFAAASWRMQLEQGIVQERHVSAVILRRQLATLVWLHTGLFSSNDIPKNILYAACTSILQSSKQVLDDVADRIAQIGDQEFEEYKALMQDSRCARVVMNSTYGMPEMLDEQSGAKILDAMKQSLTTEERERAKKEIEEKEQEHKEQVRKKTEEIESLKGERDQQRDVVVSFAKQIVAGVNEEIKWFRRVVAVIGLVVILVAFLGPHYLE